MRDATSGIIDVDRITTLTHITPLLACLPVHVPVQRASVSAERSTRSVDVETAQQMAELLSQADCSHIELKSGAPQAALDAQYDDPVVRQIIAVRRDAFAVATSKPASKRKTQRPSSAKRKSSGSLGLVPFRKVSELELRVREGPLPDLQAIAAAGAAAERAGPPQRPPPTGAQAAKLSLAFNTALQTLYAVYAALGSDGRSGSGQLTNEELARLVPALQALHRAMDGCGVASLFDERFSNVMQSFVEACVQLAKAGAGAHHATLHDELTTRPALAAQAAFHAADVLLAILLCPACPRSLIQEDALAAVCRLVRDQVAANLLAFVDAAARRDARPDWDTLQPTLTAGEQKGALKGTGKFTAAAAAGTLARLVALSKKLALKNGALTGLLRVLVATLSVPPLSSLHAAALDLLICQHEAAQAGPPAERLDVVDAVLAGAVRRMQEDEKPQRGCHPVAAGVHAHPLTLFLLRAMQCGATLPAASDQVTAATFFAAHHHLAGHAWQTLLAQMTFRPGSAPKAARAHLEARAAELAALLHSPEWPAAEVLLQSLAGRVQAAEQGLAAQRGGGKGCTVRDDREQLLELAGTLVATVLPRCMPSEDDLALFLKLQSTLRQGGAAARRNGDAGAGDVDLPTIRGHAAALRLLKHTWLQADSGLAPGVASAARAFDAAAALSGALQRVHARDTSTAAIAAHSPLACSAEDTVATCTAAARDLLALRTDDTGAQALAETALLSAAHAASLQALLLHGSLLCNGLFSLARRVATCTLVGQEQAAKTRAVAWRASAAIVDKYPPWLQSVAGQAALQSALSPQEKSASVQDKALDVLSQQLRGDRDALAAHLPLILAAAAQPATSVRRRAVDILWDCYINGAAYGEGADGARRVALLLVKCLHLYSDHEPGLRAKLLDAFTARWFAARTADAAAATAAELCAVARKLLDEPGAPAAFPLPAEAPLARLLHDVLRGGEEFKGSDAPKARRQSAAAAVGMREGATLLAEALLEYSIGERCCGGESTSGRGAPDAATAATVLLNIAAADVSLLMPPLATSTGGTPSATSPASRVSDPFRYFDSLRLQLRGAADALAAPPATDAAAAAAHRQLQSHTLASLVLVSLLLRESLRLGLAVEERVLQEVLSDVDAILRRTAGALQEGACRCLVSLALAGDTVADTVFKFCEGVWAGVAHLLPTVLTRGPPVAAIERCRRHVTLLSLMLRHLACHPQALDACGHSYDVDANRPGPLQPLPQCLLALATAPAAFPEALQDTLLGVLGQLLIGFPQLADANAAKIQPVFGRALHPGGSVQKIRRVLGSLADVARAEEAQRLHCTSAAASSAAGTLQGSEAALAVSNGTDEAASVAAGLIQSLWGALPHGASERASGLVALLLYTGLPADSDASQATRLEAARQAAAVRQDGVRLVELVHRTGSLAPWLYLPPVIALAMDSSAVVSDKALGILKYCASKAQEVELMASALALGVRLALQLHAATLAARERLRAAGAAPAAAAAHFWPAVCERFAGGLYKTLLDGNKHLEAKFFAALVSACEAAVAPAAGADGAAAAERLRLARFYCALAASVSLSRREAVMALLASVNRTIGRRLPAVEALAAEVGEGEGGALRQGVCDGEGGALRQRVCEGMCVLLRFKRFLMDAYHVSAAALHDYVPSAAKQEGPAHRDKSVATPPTELDASGEGPEQARAACELLQRLVAEDTDDYNPAHMAAAQRAKKRRSKAAAPEGTSPRAAPKKGAKKRRKVKAKADSAEEWSD